MKRLTELRKDRALRNAAKSNFDANTAQVRADLAARGVGGRIVDIATGKAKAAASEAVDIANENRGVVAATLGALALWLARKPILSLFSREQGDED